MNCRFELIKSSKNITLRESKAYPGLFVAKYKRDVFYNGTWDPLTKESRGHVWDTEGNLVVNSFTKIFNRFEGGADIPLATQVIATRKVNGFMGCVTYVPSRGECVVSTTGSLDSPFVAMARELLNDKVFEVSKEFESRPVTFMFEIVHSNDPHVVPEEIGAYLIGMRYVDDESEYNSTAEKEWGLDAIATAMDVKRPEWVECTFGEVVELARKCQHEGYVVYSKDIVLKIKSPFYLTTKFLGRLGKNKLEKIAKNPLSFKNQLDEEFWPILESIEQIKADFVVWDEQKRMDFIRERLRGLQT